MTPIRIEEIGVELVSLAEMRLYLRLDPDRTEEDGLIHSLIAAARARTETASGRLLRPARYRLAVTAWPVDGILPLPLSPLVALSRADLVDAEGEIEEVEPTLIRPGPDPWDAPCLVIDPGAPRLLRRLALIEVTAGCGGSGPPAPAPLVQAMRLSIAAWFENRGDAAFALPVAAEALIAPHRLMRL